MQDLDMGERAPEHLLCVDEDLLLLAFDRARRWPGKKRVDGNGAGVVVGCGCRSGDGFRAFVAGLLLPARGENDLGRDDVGLGVGWAGSGGQGWRSLHN